MRVYYYDENKRYRGASAEDYYGDGVFYREDFMKLRDILSIIQGKFIMSINDVPEIRKLYKQYYIEEIETTYSAGGANRKKRVTELLIMNYEPMAR
jgi:DNA adenine methylase